LSSKLKHITVSERNYHILKRLGSAGDSFNDVVTEILKRLQQAQSLPTQGHIAASESPNGFDSNG
jgi:predicted CopG family antitoxin